MKGATTESEVMSALSPQPVFIAIEVGLCSFQLYKTDEIKATRGTVFSKLYKTSVQKPVSIVIDADQFFLQLYKTVAIAATC